jgi:serine/threonine protein kinase
VITKFKSSSTYIFKKRIGSGGSAEVYLYSRRTDGLPEHEVVLKVLKKQDEKFMSELINEGRKLSELRHPNILTMFGYERIDDNRYALALEYIRGGTLKSLIPRILPEDREKVAEYVVGILASALFAAHSQKIIHGDISARNILISDMGVVKLSDFGLASVISSGEITLKGSVDYLAPERWQGQPSSQASDIFALGVLAFEILTGTNPLQGNTAAHSKQKLSAFIEGQSWTRFSHWKCFFERTLNPIPTNRGTIETILPLVPERELDGSGGLQKYFIKALPYTADCQTQGLRTQLFKAAPFPVFSRIFRNSITLFEPLMMFFLLITSVAIGVDHSLVSARQKPSVLTVTSLPWGEVFLDGKSQGFTPILNLSLRTGYHEFLWRDRDGLTVPNHQEQEPKSHRRPFDERALIL